MLLSAAAPFSVGCRRGVVRCSSTSPTNFNPWPMIKNRESPPRRISRVPQLMLCSPSNPQIRYLCDLDENNQGSTAIKLDREVSLPDIAGCHCVGSSHGFVFALPTVDDLNITAVDPLSGDSLRLPPTRGLHSDIPLDPTTHQFKPNSSLIPTHTKVTLSPSLDTAFLLRRTCYGEGYAYFARLTPPTDHDAWTPVQLPAMSLDDFVFHKGRIIAVNSSGDFIRFHATADSSKPRALIHAGANCERRDYRKCLVESPDGDELFLVCREAVDEYDEWAVYEDDEQAPLRTAGFFVYRLDKDDMCMWTPVDSLGGLAFFVGPVRSFSLPAADFPFLKPDSIYFTPDIPLDSLDFPSADSLGDTGVFDVRDGTIQFFQPPHTEAGVDWLPPTWVVPAAC